MDPCGHRYHFRYFMKRRESIYQMDHYQDLKIFCVQHKLLDAKHEVLSWNVHVFYGG